MKNKNKGKKGHIAPRTAQNEYSEPFARKKRVAKHQPKYFTEEELAGLFKVVKDPRDLAMFRLAYNHGLRASEVGMLQMSDYRVQAGRIMIRRLKGSISAEFHLTDAAKHDLRAWLRIRGTAPGAIFLSRNHRPISRRRLDWLLKYYCRHAGIDPAKAHFHSLKHSCGTHLMERGESIEDVQDQLGHASIQNTTIYAQMRNKRRDARADRLKDWK